MVEPDIFGIDNACVRIRRDNLLPDGFRAEAEEEARQIFQKRLSAIQDDTLNAMLHEEDTYSLIMVSTLLRPDKDIEIARKTWPTNR